MKKEIKPKLTLVGAGPGDPDLITLKGVKALRNADVVLYDALASEELLGYCKAGCEMIYVGKRANQPSVLQESINFLIVEKAFEKGHVVRLKGGDPFVFGRGQEEIEYAQIHGIGTEVIPGISSVIGASASANIPLTVRGISDGFWVLTGTKSDGSLTDDLKCAMKSNSTVVLLMAMNKVLKISELYIENKLGDIPVAVIQDGTTVFQKVGYGLIKNLPQIVKDNNLSNPAVIVIGEVAKFSQVDTAAQKKKITQLANNIINQKFF